MRRLAFGAVLLILALTSSYLRWMPVTTSAVCLLLGIGIGPLGLGLLHLDLDHAAGWLLHREAGGHSAHLDGSPYLPTHTSGGLLCAPDRASWDAVRAALLG